MERRSKSRAPTEVAIRCRVPASPVQVTVKDITAEGCRIALGRWRIQSGTTVVLEVNAEVNVIGRVIWTKLDTAGIKFESDLPAELLSAIREGKAASVEFSYILRPEDADEYYEPTSKPKGQLRVRRC